MVGWGRIEFGLTVLLGTIGLILIRVARCPRNLVKNGRVLEDQQHFYYGGQKGGDFTVQLPRDATIFVRVRYC